MSIAFQAILVTKSLIRYEYLLQSLTPRAEKSLVSYLGDDFLLLEGCPLPECADCDGLRSTVANLYRHCIESIDQMEEEGEVAPACVTEYLGRCVEAML